MLPEGYRMERGLLWPAHDTECCKVVFDLGQLQQVVKLCPERRIVVQAGGNCGVWPHALGAMFNHVYTFEPDPMNFRCLCYNAPGENVHKFNAALGSMPGSCSLDDSDAGPNNIGAYQIDHTDEEDLIPMMVIDDLYLSFCDLIYLDVEGYELNALVGASSTIERFRPVIAIEDKGLSERYGVHKEDAVRYVESFGYKVVARPARDVVLVPR